MAADFLLVLGDREPLAWVLTEQRMAFPEHRARQAAALSVGDRLFLYTTRGCFRSYSHDRGRVVGEAIVTSAVSLLDVPVEFDDQPFPLGCGLQITGLAPRNEGLEITNVVEALHLFPNPRAWAIQLRRVLAPLDRHDAGVLHRKLDGLTRPLQESRDEYLARTRFAVHRR
jgi:hypothetical protein